MQFVHTAFANPIVRGAIAGAVAAAVVDLHALTNFKQWADLKNYSWSIASFRWFQGAVAGAAVAAGFGV